MYCMTRTATGRGEPRSGGPGVAEDHQVTRNPRGDAAGAARRRRLGVLWPCMSKVIDLGQIAGRDERKMVQEDQGKGQLPGGTTSPESAAEVPVLAADADGVARRSSSPREWPKSPVTLAAQEPRARIGMGSTRPALIWPAWTLRKGDPRPSPRPPVHGRLARGRSSVEVYRLARVGIDQADRLRRAGGGRVAC